jgi:thiol-disulfide isomerase/thioredoxin
MWSGCWWPKVAKGLQAALVLAVAIFASAAGIYFSHGNLADPAVARAAEKLMQVSLSDPDGNPQSMAQWRGKVLIVNLWATWCVPCREEIPALMRVHGKHVDKGVQTVGIAIDTVSKVHDFSKEMKINYALLMGGMEILAISKELGNRAGVLPFTAVLDRTGKVVYTHAGALTEAALGAIVVPLL